MRNFISNAEYQGSNIEELINAGFEEGSEFWTFKQAITFYNLTGKELKGSKGCARLMKIVTKKVINKITKKEEPKKVPTYFTVFERSHIESILTANGVGV